MTLKKYTQKEFHALLEAIDRNLEAEAEAIIIGGAAAVLCYKSTTWTSDIDTFNNVNSIREAYCLATIIFPRDDN